MKVFSVRLEEMSIFLFIGIIAVGIYFTEQRGKGFVPAMMPTMSKTIVIDAGHGGWDPGKKGTVGENEKIINLQIAQKLAVYLEQGGAVVYMTRNTDEALGKKKRADMKERETITNESEGDILISIHQNSFPTGSIKGAQVFYHKQSEEGQRLAKTIQTSLITFVDPENTRDIKANNDYYILRTTKIPAALVECGFLSNGGEEQLLNEEMYQEKVAWAIYMGIMEYFSEEKGGAKAL